tara:strand:+ start:25 stop:372 length:348 start_codon:yes stop_codon:yes gene_type:complete
MKANHRGEPDRIYLQVHGDGNPANYAAPPALSGGDVTWSLAPVFDRDVEYVRADRAAHSSHAGIEQVMAAVRVHLRRTIRHHQSPHDERLKRGYIESRDRLAEMTGIDDETERQP